MEHTITSRLPNGAFGQRVAPKMGIEAYRTFEVRSPISTHFRRVLCAEMECQRYLRGWTSQFDLTNPKAPEWSKAIGQSGRKFKWERHGDVVTFHFPPGQQCFESPHMVPIDRPQLFTIRDGDWRGNPTGRVQQERQPGLFVEQFEENLSNLRRKLEQG